MGREIIVHKVGSVVLIVTSVFSLVAEWLGLSVTVRVRVRARARECIFHFYFFVC